MKFVFLLVAVVVSVTFGQTEVSEKEDQKIIQTSDEENDNSEPETTEKFFKNIQNRQRRPNLSIGPNQRTAPQPKTHRNRHPDFLNEAAIPYLGFSPNSRQSIYLSDHTGDYDVRLQHFQRQPTQFQTAIGAISAHILNQRNHREYIPYPPNGDPYNHPSYRGNPAATQPPAVRAYERETKVNYEHQPPEDLNQQTPSRFLALDGYQHATSPQFQEPTFYNSHNFFSQELPHSYVAAVKPLYDFRWYKDEREVN